MPPKSNNQKKKEAEAAGRAPKKTKQQENAGKSAKQKKAEMQAKKVADKVKSTKKSATFFILKREHILSSGKEVWLVKACVDGRQTLAGSAMPCGYTYCKITDKLCLAAYLIRCVCFDK